MLAIPLYVRQLKNKEYDFSAAFNEFDECSRIMHESYIKLSKLLEGHEIN